MIATHTPKTRILPPSYNEGINTSTTAMTPEMPGLLRDSARLAATTKPADGLTSAETAIVTRLSPRQRCYLAESVERITELEPGVWRVELDHPVIPYTINAIDSGSGLRIVRTGRFYVDLRLVF